MHNIFSALKQDTLEKHITLEKTPPFSLFHNLGAFSAPLYYDVLSIMSVFHSTASSHVSHAVSDTPCLAQLATMLNTEEVMAALMRDKETLQHNMSITPALSNTSTSSLPQKSKTHHSNRLANASKDKLDVHTVETLKNELTFRGQNSAAIAAIYVWLGSSMGANMISRRLIQLNLDTPIEYYSIMAGCAKAWVTFKQKVDNLLPELNLHDEDGTLDIVQDANTWFSFLISLGEIQSSKSG